MGSDSGAGKIGEGGTGSVATLQYVDWYVEERYDLVLVANAPVVRHVVVEPFTKGNVPPHPKLGERIRIEVGYVLYRGN